MKPKQEPKHIHADIAIETLDDGKDEKPSKAQLYKGKAGCFGGIGIVALLVLWIAFAMHLTGILIAAAVAVGISWFLTVWFFYDYLSAKHDSWTPFDDL